MMEDRFWPKVKKAGPDECWEWIGALNPISNRGMFRARNEKGKWTMQFASRIAYALVHGKIPEAMLVCHSCDNPKCVNPAHLWLGTQKDNMQDKVMKGRYFSPFKKKVSDEQVAEIRKLNGLISMAKAGEMFGLSRSQIDRIWKRTRRVNVVRAG